MRPRTAAQQYATIDALAVEAFKYHTLYRRSFERAIENKEALTGHAFSPYARAMLRGGYELHPEATVTIAKPGTSTHLVTFHFAPGVVAVWGDLGEFVLRHSEHNSLAWLLGPADDQGAFCDYTLGKIRACNGERRVFCIDEARAYLTQWMSEIVEDTAQPCEMIKCRPENGFQQPTDWRYPDLCGRPTIGWRVRVPDADPSSDDGLRVCAECVAEIVGAGDIEEIVFDDSTANTIHKLRAALDEVEDDTSTEQQRAWFRACYENDVDDPPACDTWGSGPLWLWHAIKTFRRLYRAEEAK